MRKFKIKDGKFKFDILTDDNKIVVAKLSPKNNPTDMDETHTGVSVCKEGDKFDLHFGMHIAIRNCLNHLKGTVLNYMTKLARQMEADFDSTNHYNRDKFVEFRDRRVKKAQRQAEKKAAKMNANVQEAKQ